MSRHLHEREVVWLCQVTGSHRYTAKVNRFLKEHYPDSAERLHAELAALYRSQRAAALAHEQSK